MTHLYVSRFSFMHVTRNSAIGSRPVYLCLFRSFSLILSPIGPGSSSCFKMFVPYSCMYLFWFCMIFFFAVACFLFLSFFPCLRVAVTCTHPKSSTLHTVSYTHNVMYIQSHIHTIAYQEVYMLLCVIIRVRSFIYDPLSLVTRKNTYILICHFEIYVDMSCVT